MLPHFRQTFKDLFDLIGQSTYKNLSELTPY